MVLVVVLSIAFMVGAIMAIVSLVRRKQMEDFCRQSDRVSLVEQKLVALEQEVVRQVVQPKVEEHLPALMRKYRQTVREDEYGLIVGDVWDREVNYFLERVVPQGPFPDFSALLRQRDVLLAAMPERDRYRVDLLLRKHLPSQAEEIREWISLTYRQHAAAVVQDMVQEAIASDPTDAQFDESMSGEDFELLCAEQLSRAGWKANVIGATGDQGGDIVAEKDGRRVVLQCKKYSAPVGNAAVQEVFAAMRYHAAEVACVVSNAGYTKAALQLAATAGVHLLHYSEIGELDKILGPRIG